MGFFGRGQGCGLSGLRWRRSGGRGLRRARTGEGGDDFGGGGFADLAVVVVDAALRERVLAVAGAGSGVNLERSTPGSSLARSAFFRKIWPVSSKVSTLTLPIGRPRSERISVS